MIFSLLVQESPVDRQSSYCAYRFASELLAGGHTLYRVFFFGEGAAHGGRFGLATAGETDLPRQWQELAASHGTDLVLCVGSAMRRGILDAREAGRHGIEGHSLREGFVISGLGQLVDAVARSDRVLSFGG